MVAELLGSQSFAETLLGKKGLAVGSLMKLSQFQLDLLWLTFFGKRWNVLQCESKADVTQFYTAAKLMAIVVCIHHYEAHHVSHLSKWSKTEILQCFEDVMGVGKIQEEAVGS